MLRELTKPVQPSQGEVKRIHKAVQGLHEELFKAKFGSDPAPWDGHDTLALDKFLSYRRGWTTEQVLNLIRSRFASGGIYPTRPYEWLPELSKYTSGPLDAHGYPKSSLAAGDAEISRRAAQIIEEVSQRKAADETAVAEDLHWRATSRVLYDLRCRGFEVFSAVRPESCDLVAMRNSVNTKDAMAIRIIVRAGVGASFKPGVYQAIVPPDPNDLVTYHPALKD
jgi:hypothetical protein